MTSRVVETHTSELFFVDGRVYKRKKPLDLGFCDFRTREARRSACEAEVELNRRMSPDVYLGVADVVGVDGQLCDHLVVMAQLPDDLRLARLVRTGAELGPVLRDVAAQLADLHRRSPAPTRLQDAGRPAALNQLWNAGIDALESLDPLVPAAVSARTRELALRWTAGRGPLLEGRVAAGRTYDGHGDLLADDVFALPDGARVLDCLEFDERLRTCDGIADAAFLAMDLERLGAPGLSRDFLDAYEEAVGDEPPGSLEDYYLAYRAHVRSKVAGLRAAQDHDQETAQRAHDLADLALLHLERGRIRLVLMGGLPGTGKSTLAEALAADTGWLHLSSDETRKQLGNVAPDRQQPEGFRQGLYAPTMTNMTYEALLSHARSSLVKGRSVVLDASWLDSDLRDRARRLAQVTSSDLIELRCTVPAAVADQRIIQRSSRQSEATTSIRHRLEQEEHPWPEATVIDTRLPPSETQAHVATLVGLALDARLVPIRL